MGSHPTTLILLLVSLLVSVKVTVGESKVLRCRGGTQSQAWSRLILFKSCSNLRGRYYLHGDLGELHDYVVDIAPRAQVTNELDFLLRSGIDLDAPGATAGNRRFCCKLFKCLVSNPAFGPFFCASAAIC